ncbi:hypothetical protein GOQ27_08305 [Clostridium sp. D2Q-11]|uniref:Lipoprotein n=1 Tax=Anaeromonas frigoriresistens TaxID=2683708 RepID=A0A942Z8X2_9FIRM|nr:hypothetical protein [Anaeromonas frigoriresistens]MBS4538464.1 hypothetical protein [Anaeromonas frigoriresistens]
MNRIILLLIIVILLVGCKQKNELIKTDDNINDKDEKIIKEFRSHHDYSKEELKSLNIKYLGEVDGFRIYFVPYKGSNGILNERDWIKEGAVFPIESHTRILGVQYNKLYTLSNLVYETQINIKQLYELLPEEFKTK